MEYQGEEYKQQHECKGPVTRVVVERVEAIGRFTDKVFTCTTRGDLAEILPPEHYLFVGMVDIAVKVGHSESSHLGVVSAM